MSNAWYEVLSVLHLMAMLSLSQANLLLLPRTSADGYQPKVSEGCYYCIILKIYECILSLNFALMGVCCLCKEVYKTK